MFDPSVQAEGPRPPRVLRSPLEIVASLQPLLARHVPLTLCFASGEARYRTYLVEIDADAGWLALDELLPRDGERLLRAGQAFRLEAFHEGARIAWENRLPVQSETLPDGPCHWVELPAELIYHQRRYTYRAPLGSQRLQAHLSDPGHGIAEEAELLDLSASGCRLRLRGRHDHFQPGALFARFSADLATGTVTVPVEVRHLHYDEAQGCTYGGFRFRNMNAACQRQVERFVNQVQRESRRGRFG